MKNIHILPTDKPSRLHSWTDENGSRLELCDLEYSHTRNTQHIYITSNEEIKDDDWVYCPVLKKPVFICLDSILMFKNLGYDSNGNSKYKKEWLKKIILTTDQDLIKDGVQAIDDEFLEWFVKNPSCEEVDINRDWGYPKIIIPKETELDELKKQLIVATKEVLELNSHIGNFGKPNEEPNLMDRLKDYFNNTSKEQIQKDWEDSNKQTEGINSPTVDEFIKAQSQFNKQETLEEAANRLFYIVGNIPGAKWQSERMYSEQEVNEIIAEVWNTCEDNEDNETFTQVRKRILEQFKK